MRCCLPSSIISAIVVAAALLLSVVAPVTASGMYGPARQQGATIGTVTATVLNVREEPSTAATILTKLQQGQEVEVVGRNSDATWLFIELSDGRSAWVSAEWVQVEVPIEQLPLPSTPLAIAAPATPAPSTTSAARPDSTRPIYGPVTPTHSEPLANSGATTGAGKFDISTIVQQPNFAGFVQAALTVFVIGFWIAIVGLFILALRNGRFRERLSSCGFMAAFGCAMVFLPMLIVGPFWILIVIGFGIFALFNRIAEGFRKPSKANYSSPASYPGQNVTQAIPETYNEEPYRGYFHEPSLSRSEQRRQWAEEKREEEEWRENFRKEHGRDPDTGDEMTRGWWLW